MEQITVCIVDDNSQLRDALGEIISMAPGYCCVAAIGTAEEAMKAASTWFVP